MLIPNLRHMFIQRLHINQKKCWQVIFLRWSIAIRFESLKREREKNIVRLIWFELLTLCLWQAEHCRLQTAHCILHTCTCTCTYTYTCTCNAPAPAPAPTPTPAPAMHLYLHLHLHLHLHLYTSYYTLSPAHCTPHIYTVFCTFITLHCPQ